MLALPKIPPLNLPEFVVPKHPMLNKLVSYYYFVDSNDSDYYNEFNFYPHYKTTLSIYRGAEVVWNNCSSQSKPTADPEKVNCYFSSIIKNRFNVQTVGSFNKIGVVFNVLGINQFIDCYLVDLVPKQIATFDYYGPMFKEVCEKVFREQSLSKKVDLLDAFFLTRLQKERDERIHKAVNLFFEFEKHPSIEDVASSLGVDRKTLYKLFKRHLCCSPSHFKKVVKFREAIEQYMSQEEKVKLCELAYDNYFYDQSHFIRTTEEFTEENPKQFFKGITKLGPSDTYWNLKV